MGEDDPLTDPALLPVAPQFSDYPKEIREHVDRHPCGQRIRELTSQLRIWSLANEAQLLSNTHVPQDQWPQHMGSAPTEVR